MIRIYQRENDENLKADQVIGDLRKKYKIGSVMIRATQLWRP